MSDEINSPIKKFAYVFSDENGTNQVRAFGSEISQLEFERVDRFSQQSAFLQSFVGNFISLRRDFEQIAEIEKGLLSARQSAPSIMHSAMVETLFAQAEAQRCLSNFLSSAAAFRDRALASFSRRYGNPSTELSQLKAIISREYDANLSYRVMYNLRNFSVHENAPISVMPIKLSRDDDETMSINISVMLNKSDLMLSSNVNRKLRLELDVLEEEFFYLKKLAIEYFASHRNILSSIMEMYLPSLKSEYDYFDAIFTDGGISEGAAPVLIEANKVGDTLRMKMLHVPMEMIEFFEFIESEQ